MIGHMRCIRDDFKEHGDVTINEILGVRNNAPGGLLIFKRSLARNVKHAIDFLGLDREQILKVFALQLKINREKEMEEK